MALRCLTALLIFLWTACGTAAAPVIDLSALKTTRCNNIDDYDWTLAGALFVRCATLIQSQGPDGSIKIEIAVAVLEPVDPVKAKNTPTVFIHGGPGVGIADAWWAFPSMEFVRDAPVILFDQRGAGLSSPKLCPELDKDDPTTDRMSADELVRFGLKGVKTCVAKLTENGIDVAAYGTDVTVRDMEALRAALKLEKWNIFGVSYGTTVGLSYLAQHPARVRAAILDSVYPPEMPGFSSIVPDFVKSLTALSRLCAARPRCALRFGDVATSLHNAIETLDKDPLPLEIRGQDGITTTRHLSGSTLAAILQSKLLFSGQWPQIPLLISDAEQRRPTKRLATAFRNLIDEYALASTGVYLATECRERAPFEDRTAFTRNAARWPAITRAVGAEGLFALCSVWPTTPAARWQVPQNTSVPALVVGGEWDPATPAIQAERTAATLGPRAHYVLVRRHAHSATWEEPCARTIVRNFLENPDVRPNTACASATQAPHLATRLIDVDETAAYNLQSLPAVFPVFLAGLVSVVIWPAAWLLRLGRAAQGRVLWKRSTFWLTLATAGTAVCAYPFVDIASASTWGTWQTNGIPAEAWPTFPLLALVVVATPIAAWMLLAEIGAGNASVAQLFHRGLVLTSLIAILASAWRLGTIEQLPAHVVDEVTQVISVATAAKPPPPP